MGEHSCNLKKKIKPLLIGLFNGNIVFIFTRKYPLRGYILDSGAPGDIFVTPKTYGTTFISDIL